MEPTPLQSRPADQRMTQGHPEARPDRSQEPNCSNSFIRDQIKDPDPTGGPPPEGIPNSQPKPASLRSSVGNHTPDPQGDPIAKQLRIDEWKKPSFRSRAQKSATRPEMGDPIAKARHQPPGKVRKKSSFRSRSGTNPDPTG